MCSFCSTRFLLNLLGNWRECVWAAVFKSISLRLDRSRTNLCFIKLNSVLLQPLFDSWAANTQKRKTKRTANQIFFPFKAHLKVSMKKLILDSLLIPFNSQMKKCFWNFKGSLENSFKAQIHVLWEYYIRQAMTRGKFCKDNKVKNKTVRIPKHTE